MLWWSDSFTVAACIAAFMASTVADWQWLTVSRSSFLWCQAQRQFDTGCMYHCFHTRDSNRLTVAICDNSYMYHCFHARHSDWLHVSLLSWQTQWQFDSGYMYHCFHGRHSDRLAVAACNIVFIARHSDSLTVDTRITCIIFFMSGTVTQLDSGYIMCVYIYKYIKSTLFSFFFS